jgi:signal peptidase I
MKSVVKFLKANKGTILFLFLMLFYRSAVADWYHVPSGSMKPNILIGDRVWVDKLAYDVKIPLTEINLNRHQEPARGDVVVFNSAVSNDRLIKRVIAIPGDMISMVSNQVFINGQPLKLKPRKPANLEKHQNDSNYQLLQETHQVKTELEHISYAIQIDPNSAYLTSFGPVVVAADYLWVMGDNRDNSADSRVIGLVPRSELVGKATQVIISFDKQNYYLPRTGRYLQAL